MPPFLEPRAPCYIALLYSRFHNSFHQLYKDMMPLTRHDEIRKSEGHKLRPEALSETFSELEQTAICPGHLVHCVFTGPRRCGASDSHHGIGQYPYFPSPGFSTSTYTRAEDLPLTWNDDGRLVYPLAHVQSRDALKHRTSGTCCYFEGPGPITAGLVQMKDECKILCLGKVGMQSRGEHGTSMLGRAPAIGEHAEKPQKNPVSARTAWENSTARYYSYIRLKQSMSILGLVGRREQLQLLNWIRCQYQLEWQEMIYHLWEVSDLELIMKRWKEGAEERGRWQGTSRKAEY